jgi:hypothetical protein
MAQVDTIDSNATGLRYAEELSFKVLPGSPIWIPLEPNSYSDFGGNPTLTPRNPINDSRQRSKGPITDLEVTAGINSDLTQTNLQDLMQGYFFADFRPKGEEIVTLVDVDTANPDEYQVAATAGFKVGDLIQGQNFVEAANNAVNEVVAVVVDTSVEVIDGVLTDETPPADAQIVVIGVKATVADDVDVDATGLFPAYVSATLDWTTLGLSVGELIFVGGDVALSSMVTAANNGWKRVRTISATRLEIDKSDLPMVDETAGTSLLLEIYFGRVLKNEAAALIIKRFYQLERSLGAPDDTLPAEIQAEYLIGCLPATVNFNIPNSSKLEVDLTWVGGDNETIDGPTVLKTGARPGLEDADGFNTASDFSRIRLAEHTDGVEAPVPLFAFAQELTITINNNVTANKAVGTLGAIGITAGTFEIGGSITAYFANVSSQDAVRNNVDVTLDAILVKNNAGISFDMPLIALGEGRPNVEQDAPITVPLEMAAARGRKIDPAMDHTLMMVFYDFLPNAADT